MKKFTLFLMTMILFMVGTISSFAQEEPAAPKFSPMATDGTVQYLYNVETHTFVTGGNDWGTRATASFEKGNQFKVIENGGTYKLSDLVGTNWNAIDCDGNADSWIDGQGRAGDGTWNITAVGENTYEITNTVKPAEGKKWCVLRDLSNTRVVFKDENVAYGATWAFVSEEDYAEYMAILDKEALNAYTAAQADVVKEALKEEVAAANKVSLDAMKAIIEGTNVYGEGYEAYAEKYADYLAKLEAGTLEEVVVNPSSTTGWHASTAFNFLLTPWISNGKACNNFENNLYINTWSNEGLGDGSNFLVPFFEYFAGDDSRLGVNTIKTTVSGLEPGKAYNASVWARVRITNNTGDSASGITFQAGNGEAVDICDGDAFGGVMRIKQVTATGVADEEGNLVVAINVEDGNNVSWLSFKNVYVEAVPEPEAPVIAIEEGEGTYTITSTSADAALYYLCKPMSWLDEGETPESCLQSDIEGMGAMVDSKETWEMYDHMGMQPAPKTFTVADYEEMYAGQEMFIIAANVGWDGEKLAIISNIEVKNFTVPAPEPKPELAEGDYVIKNVAEGRYLNGANSWGTKASTTLHGQFMTLAKLEDGTYTIDSHHSNGGDKHYLAAGDNTFIDALPVGHTIEAVAEGIFTIKDSNGKYLAANEGLVNFNADEVTEAAQWQFITKEDILAQETPADFTALIKDANFNRNNTEQSAWDIVPSLGGPNYSKGENITAAGLVAEKWGGNSQEFTSAQTIELPNGKYILKVQGFYRYNNTTDNTNDVAAAAHADGTEEINSFLFANDQEVALMSIADETAVETYGKMPFSQAEAAAAFVLDLYQNELEVEVTDGTLTLGVKKTSHPGTDWTVWDNFELTYLGAAEAEEPEIAMADMAFAVAEDEQIDEDGDFKVEFTYTAAANEAAAATFPQGLVAYKVTDAEENVVDEATRDFEIDATSRNIYVKNLEAGKTYTITATKVYGAGFDMEALAEVEIPATIEGELPSLTFTVPEAEEPEDENLIEIAQDQGKELDDFTRADLVEGEEYNTYTVHGDLQIAFKMMNLDVKDCDYVIVKFAEPVEAGWNLAFWNGTETVAVAAGSTEYKYVFADDEKCAVKDGILPQICMMTLWGAPNPLEAKVTGVYKHMVPATPEIALADMQLNVAEDEQIDEDGEFKVEFTYTASANEAATATFPQGMVAYQVTDAEGSVVDENERDFDLILTSRNIYVKNLEAGKTYTLTVTKVYGAGLDMETWEPIEIPATFEGELPSVTFTVAEPATSINGISTAVKANGKYLENGKVVIVRNGVKYNIGGSVIK